MDTQKKISVNVSGNGGRSTQLEIGPDDTAETVLKRLQLKDHVLSKGPDNPFGPGELVFPGVDENEVLTALPVPREA